MTNPFGRGLFGTSRFLIDDERFLFVVVGVRLAWNPEGGVVRSGLRLGVTLVA